MDSVSQPSENCHYRYFLKEASRPPRSDRHVNYKICTATYISYVWGIGACLCGQHDSRYLPYRRFKSSE